jgi:hypothetical protein
MAIVAVFDVHRAQITFDALNRETGEVHRGRIQATPEAVRRWAGRFPGERVEVAVEACTGWLFVCEVRQAGFDGGLDSRILSSGEETLRRHGTSEEVPARAA